MNGIALLLSTIVYSNSSMTPQTNIVIQDSEIARVNEIIKIEEERKLMALADMLKGQTLKITTLEDYPLSYSTELNGRKLLNGTAGKILDILRDAYDFDYELVFPEYNIVGGSNDSKGSMMQMLIDKVKLN
jgi:hypothetical protein